MKLKKLIMNELEKELYLWVWTYKDVKAFAKLVFEEDLDDEEYSEIKWICLTKKSVVGCFVITDNTNEVNYSKVLNHEISHWVHYVLDYIWHPMDYSGTEILAYYVSYYIKQWDIFLHELRKKKKKKK